MKKGRKSIKPLLTSSLYKPTAVGNGCISRWMSKSFFFLFGKGSSATNGFISSVWQTGFLVSAQRHLPNYVHISGSVGLMESRRPGWTNIYWTCVTIFAPDRIVEITFLIFGLEPRTENKCKKLLMVFWELELRTSDSPSWLCQHGYIINSTRAINWNSWRWPDFILPWEDSSVAEFVFCE